MTLTQREKPALPAGGAVAKIKKASVCGTDIRTYRFGSSKVPNGRIIGHEACYILEELDAGIKGFKKGDRVIIAPAVGCGGCKQCKKGKTNMCDTLRTIGYEWDGTFAEYCAIPEQAFKMGNVIKVPDSVTDLQACLAEPVACAINAQSYLKIEPGENVLVYGAGYLGCIHAELALLSGAGTVIIAEVSEKRRNQAKKLVKNVIITDPTAPDFRDSLKKFTDGKGIDVVITACPAGVTHKDGLEIINKLGRMSLFGGLPGSGVGYLDSNLIHYKEVGVFGVHASSVEDNKLALSLIEKGKLDVKKYAAEFNITKLLEAMEKLISEDVCKAVLSC